MFVTPFGYLLEHEDQCPIVDLKAREVGQLSIKVIPIDPKTNAQFEDVVEDPKELVGRTVKCEVVVSNCRGLSSRVSSSRVQFDFLGQSETFSTDHVMGMNPNYDKSFTFGLPRLDMATINAIEEKSLIFAVYGKHKSGQKKVIKQSNESRLNEREYSTT